MSIMKSDEIWQEMRCARNLLNDTSDVMISILVSEYSIAGC